jgi:hypothetical protein
VNILERARLKDIIVVAVTSFVMILPWMQIILILDELSGFVDIEFIIFV